MAKGRVGIEPNNSIRSGTLDFVCRLSRAGFVCFSLSGSIKARHGVCTEAIPFLLILVSEIYNIEGVCHALRVIRYWIQ
jgi:hypothetical protein